MNKKGDKEFEKLLEDIRSIKIQGAENVAKAGIKAYLLSPTKKSLKKILSTRPTEPLMQNALNIISRTKNPKISSRKFLKDMEKSHKEIAKKGANLIKDDMNIFTHCHSSTVIDILKYAKIKQKKKFTVYTTEVEPLLQGRMTARDLSKIKIPVIIAPDLAAEESLKKCDVLLFGSDAFTTSHVANKIGTYTLTKIAIDYGIPRYSCGVSMKFTDKIIIKMRSAKEVWDTKIKGIKVLNPPFDKTPIKCLSGIISEFGVLPHREFVKAARCKMRDF